jgi:hypothetical protein
MKKTVVAAALGLAVIAGGSTASHAAQGCGPGWYYNGYRCVPAHGPRYRDYDGGRFYRERPRNYGGYADRGHPYGYNHNYGDPRCGRPNYTIQDGVCKPYTGR